jgi:Kef-type K+ transport system membrane component KefB
MGGFGRWLGYRLVPLALIVGLLLFLRGSGLGDSMIGARSSTFVLGFLLIAAFVAGQLAGRARLPRISGYLGIGVVLGPHLTGLLTTEMLAGAKAVEGVAVALIALTAGGEIRLDWLRKRARALATITFCQIALVGTSTFVVVFAGRRLFPFVPDDPLLEAAVVALALSAIAISNSPTVTIAVISESGSSGPLSRTVLGITVLVDLCVIVLFTVMLSFARDMLGGGGGEPLGLTLLREIGGSLLTGVLVGVAVSWFLNRVNRDVPVFVLLVCFTIWQLAEQFHLEALLIALAAGFWVENFSSARGEVLIKGIERMSLPVYAIFFAASGAKVNLSALGVMGPLALLLASVRAGAIWTGIRLGTSLAPVEPVVKRYAWLGLISQAGVTLALASILARAFPGWGEGIQTLIVAMIALHEMLGPIGFQLALSRAGELGAARRDETPA